MCGIFAYLGSRSDASQMVLKGLKQLEYRGYDSWGVAYVPSDSDTFLLEKHIGKIGTASLSSVLKSGCALGHTRWATHGGVTQKNAHPHLDSQGNLSLVHNGIIENYLQLKQKLQEKGYSFVSETDTEVVVYLIEENLKTLNFVEAASRAFSICEGLNAFVVLHKTSQEIIAYRKGSPLVCAATKEGLFLASDATALSEYSDKVYFLEDYDLLHFSRGKITLMSNQTKKAKALTWQKLEFRAQDMSKGKYDHFLLKEVMEQPRVLAAVGDTLESQIRTYARNLEKFPVLVGCGTAYHAALMGTYFLSEIAHTASLAYSGSEFSHFRPLMNDKHFVSFLSQSGETIDIVEHAQYLDTQKVAYGAIVNRIGSTLERLTHSKILIPAGPEQCVLATKSYTAKLAILFLLAHQLVGTMEQGKNELKNAVQELGTVLKKQFSTQYVQPLAKKLAHEKHIYIFGRGKCYPLALEAALKIKEVTYIHTDGLAGGELKHGAIALIDKGTPCIVLAPVDNEYQTVLSNAMEVKARGAFVIGISPHNNEAFDLHIPVPELGTLTMLPIIVCIQLLAYSLALELGNDPDKPRNLAKSVTVK